MGIKNTLRLIMMGVLLIACGPQTPATNSPKVLTVDGNFSNHVWSQLTYTVSGGGDISFTVTPVSGSAEFQIHVSRSNFQPCNFNFSLKPTDSLALYTSVANLMDGSSVIQNVPSTSGYSGSWTSISFYHAAVGSSQTFTSFTVVGDTTVISALYSYVQGKI